MPLTTHISNALRSEVVCTLQIDTFSTRLLFFVVCTLQIDTSYNYTFDKAQQRLLYAPITSKLESCMCALQIDTFYNTMRFMQKENYSLYVPCKLIPFTTA